MLTNCAIRAEQVTQKILVINISLPCYIYSREVQNLNSYE
jgi:hypothetical protein